MGIAVVVHPRHSEPESVSRRISTRLPVASPLRYPSSQASVAALSRSEAFLAIHWPHDRTPIMLVAFAVLKQMAANAIVRTFSHRRNTYLICVSLIAGQSLEASGGENANRRSSSDVRSKERCH